MTYDERQTVLRSTWEALLSLIPTGRLPRAALHVEALRLVYAEDSSAHFGSGLRTGVLSVEAREDRRDPLDVEDAPELKSIH